MAKLHCDGCGCAITHEPLLTTRPNGQYFTCSSVCQKKVEAELDYEAAHQLRLALADRGYVLGRAAWNGA